MTEYEYDPTHETIKRIEALEKELEGMREMVFTLNKTVEGMQHLFVKAGEYQGKPRGRLPR